jgi:hypothetical protein
VSDTTPHSAAAAESTASTSAAPAAAHGATTATRNSPIRAFAACCMRLAHSRDLAPRLLLVGFMLTSLVTVLTQAQRYGITTDEPLQQLYGEGVLAWYRSFGANTGFLTMFPAAVHMPEHGGIVDALIVALQSWLGAVSPWLVRRLVSGLVGWLGVVAIALCGYELGGAWVALAAGLGLWLYPRYYGAMFNNPKDIPAAVSLTFVLWMTLLLLRYWPQRLRRIEVSVLLGCSLGAATAIRITALTWFAVLAMLLVGWWLLRGQTAWRERRVTVALARQGGVAGVIAGSWLLSTMALWPFIFLNPFANLLDSIHVMSHYPWNGSVLFDGVKYAATQLPVSYVPTWLVIGSPPMLLLLALVGAGIIVAQVARTRRINPAVATVAVAFVIPLASLLLLHPVLYDTLRQFLYIIPPLVLLAAYGLVRGVRLLLRQYRPGLRWVAVGLLALTIISYAQVVVDMAVLSPYEYIYFSPLVGGLQGAVGSYDTDYYGTCSSAAAEWLSQNYRHYTTAPAPTLDTAPLLQIAVSPLIPTSFRRDASHPDFYIGFTRDHTDQLYPTYQVAHVVAVEGTTLCVVKINPALTQSG